MAVAPKHILIVGGGVIGLCTAHFCRRAGHRVTLLERGAPDHDCCSLGNAGYVSPSHFIPLAAPGMVRTGLRMMRNPRSPFYIKPRLSIDLLRWGWKFMRACTPRHVDRSAPLLRDLNLASRACYEQLAQERNNDFGFVRRGLLMLCKSPDTLEHEKELGRRGRTLGVPGEPLTPDETARLEPNLKADIVGAVYFPDDCHLSPMKFVPGLAHSLQRDGVDIRWNTAVTGWESHTPAAATTRHISAVRTSSVSAPAALVEADEYVIAGGSWSPSIARSLRLHLPMQAGKGYSLTLPSPRRLPAVSAILTEARVAITPMGSSLRFGGTMEIAGMDESINPERVRGIIDAVPRYLPEFSTADFDGIPPWRGLRPVSPDGLPYVGRFRAFDNLSVAAGHAMLGLSLGPITGKLMSQLLSATTPEIDLTLLSPDRFA